MNETLSVIEEHMQDMSTPRDSLTVLDAGQLDDSESEYSTHHDKRSYVAGPETDDEESAKLTERQVKSWDHIQTASHLRSIGVDPAHCDIFEEQEITGEVLLEMDQAFIYMKEFDFGLMGRRLKTWHKIRALQEEAKGSKMSRQNTTTSTNTLESGDKFAHSHGPPGFPSAANFSQAQALSEAYKSRSRANTLLHDPIAAPQPLQTQSNAYKRSSIHGSTPSSPWRASMTPDSPSRPSAALIREISHSRRHSSIDLDNQPPFDVALVATGGTTLPHKKQPSFDREWSMVSSNPLTVSPTTQSSRLPTMSQRNMEAPLDASFQTSESSVDLLDRGYFSGPESDNRKVKKLLRKRDNQGSPGHSRQSSMLQDPRMIAPPAAKRHSRLSSADSIRDLVPRVTSSAARAYHSKTFKSRLRSSSARTASPLPFASAVSPTVTNLENGLSPRIQALSPRIATDGKDALPPASVPAKARKVMGLRAISDAVTGNEKAMATPVTGPILGESPVDSPTGSNTPSGTSRSLEIDNADGAAKAADTAMSALASKTSSRPRPKTKQQTSAYRQGLQKISPAEARKTCDYSGWMKKKSASLLTTWKPRLFILHGRRLSYYYSEDDTEERGIIDISGHKVLVANSDPITTLHATITGAASSPPPGSAATSAETSPVVTRSPQTSHEPFYFKLVPPKVGFTRAVQFTRPTVHYFQVENIAEGRKWMGEMMKATIEHDMSTFETTNKQKTITLAKARARKEKPPFLRDADEPEGSTSPDAPVAAVAAAAAEDPSTTTTTVAEDTTNSTEPLVTSKEDAKPDAVVGLQIQGLTFEKDKENRELGERSSFEGIFDDAAKVDLDEKKAGGDDDNDNNNDDDAAVVVAAPRTEPAVPMSPPETAAAAT